MRICKNLIEDYSYSNFTEDEIIWSSSSTYLNGGEAREGHYIYTYAGISDTNTLTTPSLNPDYWLKTRATNYFAMLGDRTDEQTLTNGNLIIEFPVSNYDTLSLLNLKGKEVIIEVTDLDTSTIVYTENRLIADTSETIDAYSYYFGEFLFLSSYYNNILPLVTNAKIRIEVVALLGVAGIGRLVSGQSFFIGDTLFGTSETLESYSRVETDEFGTTTLTPRQSVYNSAHSLRILSQKVGLLKRKRKELDAVPILFIADEELDSRFENLLSYGLWQNADIIISRPTYSDMSVTIKELL